MKGVWAVPVMFSILFIGSLGLTPNAYAASGTIVSINPAENHGMIELFDGDSNALYQFRIPQDVEPDYVPSVGHFVSFDIVPENSKRATNVSFINTCAPGSGCGF